MGIQSNRAAGQAAIEAGTLVRATPNESIAPPTPPLTQTNKLNSFLFAPLPASYTQQPDQQRQFQMGGVISQERVPPLPAASNANSGAQAASQAIEIVETTPSSSGTTTASGVTSVGLEMPSIFAVSGSPITSSGTFDVTLTSEPTGTVFKAPDPGLTNLTGFFSNNYANNSATTNPTITFTPPSTGWAFYMEAAAGNSNTAPSGWTAWGDGAVLTLSSTSSVTATDTNANAYSWCNAVLTFSGSIPSFVANHHAAFTLNFVAGSGTASVTVSPTAGNYLIVSVYGAIGTISGSISGISVSASNADSLIQVATAYAAGAPGFNGPVKLATYIAPNVVGGSTTIQGSVTGDFTGGSGFTLSVTEVTPFASGSGIPVFQPLSASDLPGISASQIAGGTLSTSWGGTGANLSSTGGTSQFLTQTSTGAAITVVQPDFSNLAGSAGDLATSYNGVSLVSNGLPSEIAKVDLTAQGAAITATTLYAVPSGGAGMYRVSWVATVTQVATASSVLGGTNGFQIVYTDKDTSVVKTMPGTIVAGVNTNSTNSTSTGTISGSYVIYAKASTNIQYQMDYTSSGATSMQYNLHIKLEAL